MTFPVKTTVQGYPIRTGPGGAYIPKTLQGMQLLGAWKKENASAPDAWLRLEICKGSQQMLLLRLDGAPAAELIAMTAEMWVTLIGPNLEEQIDRQRICKGFELLQRKIKRWPQPADLLEILPTRMVGKTAPKTTEAPISDEAHARGSAAFEEILEKMK